MKRFIMAMALVAVALAAPASADDPSGNPPTSDADGGDTGGSAVNCGPGIVHYTDTFHRYLGRTFRVAGRLYFHKCYDSGPGANYIRVTHVGAWYDKTAGSVPDCAAVAGAPRIDGFQVNINGFDGYDPAPIWVNCDTDSSGAPGLSWVDIPNRAVYGREDRCFDVPWGKIWTADGNTHAFSNFEEACLPWP